MIKMLKNKEEIVKAVNNLPVVYVEDIAKCKTDYGWCLGKIRVPFVGYTEDADLYIYSDKLELVTTSYGACIHAWFGWHDVKEMAMRANYPVVKAHSDFVLVLGKWGKFGVVIIVTVGEATKTDEPLIIRDDMRLVLGYLGEL